MRIAMIIEAWEPIWGGGQAHVLELSKKLAENHHCEIDIFTMNFLDENGKIQDKIEEIGGGKIKIIRTGKIRNFTFKDRMIWIFEVIGAIKKYHQEKKYDLIHAHANLPGIPGKILSSLLKIPIVYTVHGSNFMDMGKKNLFYFVERILFTKIKYDKEISVSRDFLKYKNVNSPVFVPNGVDVEKFDEARGRFASFKDNGAFKILFVGRLDYVKGIDILLKAIRNIKDELTKKNVRFHLVGYGLEEETLKKICASLDLEEIVKFCGKLQGDELLKEYVTSDLFILPSRSEGFPLTILEAWAAQLPVIATDVGENIYLIKNGENGYLMPSNNAGEVARILLETIGNKNLKRMGENGYNLVKENYSWVNVAVLTYEEYSKVCKR